MAVDLLNEFQTDKYNSLFARDSHRASWQQPGLLVWDDCKDIRTKKFEGEKKKRYRILLPLCMLFYKCNIFNIAQI